MIILQLRVIYANLTSLTLKPDTGDKNKWEIKIDELMLLNFGEY